MAAPTTYAELQASILAWIDDSSANVNPTECIAMAEARMNRVLRAPQMETSTTLTAAASVDLPGDFLSFRAVYLETDPRVVLEPVTPTVLRQRYNAQTTGQPEVYTITGSVMNFGPEPDSAYDISVIYKAKIPALSDSVTTNWLLAAHPDIYIVASLMMAEMRGWNDQRASTLKPWWDEMLAEVNQASNAYQYGSAPLRLRSSVRGAC